MAALEVSAAGVLTAEVGGDGVPGQEAVDGNLIDDVDQQEGHTGEAEGLQQTPCVAWEVKKKKRTSIFTGLVLDLENFLSCAIIMMKFLGLRPDRGPDILADTAEKSQNYFNNRLKVEDSVNWQTDA